MTKKDWHTYQIKKYSDPNSSFYNLNKSKKIKINFDQIQCKLCGEKNKKKLIYRKNSRGFYYFMQRCRSCENNSDERRKFNQLNLKKYHKDHQIKEIYNKRARISRLKKLGADTSDLDHVKLDTLYESDYVCPISLKKLKKNGLFHFDHHHKYGYLRKLIFNRVNAGLGAFNDDPLLIQIAVNYLKKRKLGINLQQIRVNNVTIFNDLSKILTKKNGTIKKEPSSYRSFMSRNKQIKNFNSIFFNLLHKVITKCEICGQAEKQSRKLSIDHYEDKVRGVLCIECNRGLGNFNEDIEELKRAIDYLLQEHKSYLKKKLNFDFNKMDILKYWHLDIVELKKFINPKI